MENILTSAQNISTELLTVRRTLHYLAESGETLSKTTAFVKEKLSEYGLEPFEICESGIVALLGKKGNGKTLLLRADMDALPIEEKTGLPFAATNGCMHACGHDMHTAMLLGCAKILSERKDELGGNIKFVFQPNEENFRGAELMIKSGVLFNPSVDAGLSLHIISGLPSGQIFWGCENIMAGCIFFKIVIKGKGCHGAMPETGTNPIGIAANICLSLNNIISNEISKAEPAVLSVGKFSAGDAPNIIPETAVLEGSIRSTDSKVLERIYYRICEISKKTAEMFYGTSSVQKLCEVPPLYCNGDLTLKMKGYLSEIFSEKSIIPIEKRGMGSEDFSRFAKEIPSAYFILGAGTTAENSLYGKPMHSENVIFNEDILPGGCALFAHCARRWLSE